MTFANSEPHGLSSSWGVTPEGVLAQNCPPCLLTLGAFFSFKPRFPYL